MTISETMDLRSLLLLMGEGYDLRHARAMRDLLVERVMRDLRVPMTPFIDEADTADIPREDWDRLRRRAALLADR